MTEHINPVYEAIRKRVVLQRRTIQSMKGVHPLRLIKERRKLRGLEEAERDILNTGVTGFGQNGQEVDKNNYRTYEAQVRASYDMYEARADYGAEMFGGIVDMRVAFICGEGVSYTTKNKAAAEWIKQFLTDNRLNGSRLVDIVTTGELEGRDLLTLGLAERNTGLAQDKGKKYVTVDELSWQKLRYAIEEKAGRVSKISYQETGANAPTVVDLKKSTYLVLGRTLWNNCNATPNRLHKVLTDFENFSRAKYDLRNNTHLFGRVMQDFKTDSPGDAAAVSALLKSSGWQIGDGYVGPADHRLLEPTGAAGASIEKDALLSLKLISSASGIPMHYLAWPELMSNRATAESLIEVVNAATLRERLVWAEAFKDLILKAMVYAIDSNGEKSAIIPDDLEVQFSLVSVALIKQLAEVWGPEVEAGRISKHTYYSRMPGNITYEGEQEFLDEEKEDAAEDSPLQNEGMAKLLDEARKSAVEKSEAPTAEETSVVE